MAAKMKACFAHSDLPCWGGAWNVSSTGPEAPRAASSSARTYGPRWSGESRCGEQIRYTSASDSTRRPAAFAFAIRFNRFAATADRFAIYLAPFGLRMSAPVWRRALNQARKALGRRHSQQEQL